MDRWERRASVPSWGAPERDKAPGGWLKYRGADNCTADLAYSRSFRFLHHARIEAEQMTAVPAELGIVPIVSRRAEMELKA